MRLTKRVRENCPTFGMSAHNACTQIMDLENKVSELSESAKSGGGAHERRKPELCIPRGPELHCLSGHREPVLRVVFHPKFNLIASASEDASVKVSVRSENSSVNAKIPNGLCVPVFFAYSCGITKAVNLKRR